MRSIEIDALVDTGATMLTIPEELVETLGLISDKDVMVTYANGEKEKRPVAFGAKVEILNRQAESSVLVGRKGTKVLIFMIYPISIPNLLIF